MSGARGRGAEVVAGFAPRALSVAISIVAVAAALLAPAPARADFGIEPGSFDVLAHAGEPGSPELSQAGAHPNLTVAFRFNTAKDADGRKVPDETVKDIGVELPPGFVGNPTATPRCSHRDFQVVACSPQSIVGTQTLSFSPFPGVGPFDAVLPVYNLVPPDGVVAQLGFQITTVSVVMTIRVRPDGGYNLSTTLSDLSEGLQIYGTTLTLWGVPADHNGPGPYSFYPGSGPLSYGGPGDGPRVTFMTSPTLCGDRLTSTIRVASWQHPERWATDSSTSASGLTGCDHLDFEPSIDVRTNASQADSASGLGVQLTIPQNSDPDGLATPTLRHARVTLPDGVSISPAGADGLAACSDAQFGLQVDAVSSCPEAAKVGNVRIDTPLLDQPLTGPVYVGTQRDSDPASGRLFRLFVDAHGSGVTIKLLGAIHADPNTGRLTAVFDDNPQLPFSSFRLDLNDGPRAPLATPPDCGPKTTSAQLTPFSSSAPIQLSSSFAIDCPGLSGFGPAFRAGTTNPLGGAFSPFALRIERPDRQDYVNGVSVTLPPGLLARLRGVPLCPDAQADAGGCSPASRVGTATVAAGAGAHPLFLQGTVSLTGPYKGAPYGLAVTVPAVAGPYDLGTVVVRQALQVDPDDAHVTVVSDPLPTIVKGVPLRLRTIDVAVDRPTFTRNPTSCRARQIAATLSAAGGATARLGTRFQARDCRRLALRPRLRLALTGRRQRTTGKHPGLRALLTQPVGQANMRRVGVALPLSLALDPNNARSLCEYEDGQRVQCPRSSIVGSATAVSPLLNRPLSGPIYFVKGVRQTARGPIRTLPTLLITLRGELALNLRARSSVRHGKLISTFPAIPDAAVSRFGLTLKGGRGGILVANSALCRGSQIADVEIDGQNGRRADSAVRMSAPCGQATRRR